MSVSFRLKYGRIAHRFGRLDVQKGRIFRLSYFLESGAAERTSKRNLASDLRNITNSNSNSEIQRT